MDNENIEREESEVTAQEVLNSIEGISELDWENAKWPVISYASRNLLERSYQNSTNGAIFWKEVLNPDHFINIQESTKYNPKTDFIFLIHSFKDSKGEEIVFKTVTTTPESFVQDPGNMINYGIHGFPCENRGGGEYPTLKDFWKEFYDRLSQDDMDRYPIPTLDWRKKGIKSWISQRK